MRKFLITTLILMVCGASLKAQKIDTDFKFSGGRSDQKEMKTIFISDIQIKQFVRKKGTAKAGGGIGGNMAFANMTVDFGGVAPDAYQQMLSEVYDEIAKKLTGLGYQVMTGEDAKAKSTREFQTVNGIEESKNDIILKGHVIKVHPKDKVVSFADNAFGVSTHYVKIAKDINAIVLSFNYLVDYVSYDKSGGGFALKAKIEAEPEMVISGGMNTAVPTGGGFGTMKPLKAGGDWIGSQGIYETSSGKMTPWFGMGASSSSSKWTMDIDQTKYLGLLKSNILAAALSGIDSWQAGLK